MASTSKKTFQGSCHCNFISYKVHVALPDPPVASRCNCTICQKRGFTSLAIDSESDFELKTPKSFDEMADYQLPSSKAIHRYFCPTCGVHVFTQGSYEYEGSLIKIQSVNVLTLDQPQEGLELSEWKIEYWDARTDNWAGGKKEKPWTSGLV